MSGTVAGGLRAAQTLKNKNPNHYKEIGAKGGKLGTTGGFYANHELAKIAGSNGGKISSRAGVKNGEGNSRSTLYARRKALKAPKWYSIRYRFKLKRQGLI